MAEPSAAPAQPVVEEKKPAVSAEAAAEAERRYKVNKKKNDRRQRKKRNKGDGDDSDEDYFFIRDDLKAGGGGGGGGGAFQTSYSIPNTAENSNNSCFSINPFRFILKPWIMHRFLARFLRTRPPSRLCKFSFPRFASFFLSNTPVGSFLTVFFFRLMPRWRPCEAAQQS